MNDAISEPLGYRNKIKIHYFHVDGRIENSQTSRRGTTEKRNESVPTLNAWINDAK
jgi:hypothetical protein